MVFGNFGEGPQQVYETMKLAARGIAEAPWRELCLADAAAAFGPAMARLKRTWGITAVRSRGDARIRGVNIALDKGTDQQAFDAAQRRHHRCRQNHNFAKSTGSIYTPRHPSRGGSR